MTAAVDRVHAECGKVDMLINNAGVELIGTVAEMPPARWSREKRTRFVCGTIRVRTAGRADARHPGRPAPL